MEVHHHAHSSRKKWTHYFWDFLMLFLAVFCGFLAENEREHMVEHRREKQYMRSITEDLKEDIMQVENIQPQLNAFLERLDSLSEAFYQYPQKNLTLSTIKQLNKGWGFSDFIYNDRTIQQLKYAGNMRLVRNLRVADSISFYDATVRRGLVHQYLVNENAMPAIDKTMKESINSTLVKRLAEENPGNELINALLPEIVITPGRTEVLRIVNEINSYKANIKSQLVFVSRNKAFAERLLALVKKEYHLN